MASGGPTSISSLLQQQQHSKRNRNFSPANQRKKQNSLQKSEMKQNLAHTVKSSQSGTGTKVKGKGATAATVGTPTSKPKVIYSCCGPHALFSFDQLPVWLQDNHYILNGHRPKLSLKECLKSLFYYHNETLSIYTHLLAALFFVVLIPITYYLKDLSSMDMLIFGIFFTAAVSHFLFSTVYHLLFCVSPTFYLWLAKLDYTGISVMISGSFIPPIYYGFLCSPLHQKLYIGMISVFGIIGLIVSSVPTFSQPRFRTFRAAFFVAFGLGCFIPVPQFLSINGFEWAVPVLWKELVMGVCYLIGAYIYASRYPESKYPGKFDFTFTSHTIWHLFTIVAALAHYFAILEVYNQRQLFPCHQA